MLADLLETDRGGLRLRRDETLSTELAGRYEGWIARRAGREPAQHITGRQEFRGLVFAVDRRVLIPRPETESIVEIALDLGLPAGARVVDLGTGSGCLAVTLAVERSDLVVHALDRSADALVVARANAARHGVGERVEFVEADFAEAPGAWDGTIDLVVSNPPYVPAEEWRRLEPEVREHDPREALVPGPTGLEAYRSVADGSRRLLRPGGRLIVEIGHGQAEAVRAIVSEAGLELVEIRPDFQGIPRTLLARCG